MAVSLGPGRHCGLVEQKDIVWNCSEGIGYRGEGGGVVVVVIDIKIICFFGAFPIVGSIMISESVTNNYGHEWVRFQSGAGILWFLGKIQ